MRQRLSEHRVQPRFEDGRLVPNEYGYTVSMSASGLLLFILAEGYEQEITISRFAWDGIVAAVAALQTEAKERARRNVIVDELLYGEP